MSGMNCRRCFHSNIPTEKYPPYCSQYFEGEINLSITGMEKAFVLIWNNLTARSRSVVKTIFPLLLLKSMCLQKEILSAHGNIKRTTVMTWSWMIWDIHTSNVMHLRNVRLDWICLYNPYFSHGIFHRMPTIKKMSTSKESSCIFNDTPIHKNLSDITGLSMS